MAATHRTRVRDVLAIDGCRLRSNPLQHADDVHLRLVRDFVPLPIAGLARPILAEDADLERGGMRGGVAVFAVAVMRVRFVGCHSISN